MYTIGQFAAISQLSKKMLRFYDEINLLKPAKVGLPEKQTTLYKRSKYRDNLNKKCTEERGKALKSVHFTMG
ncbi:MerR family DNA-binding transcriptional regulator [Gracilinema caldarium]|uniref:MerR family DNA-binding transcriptional regulator n=1 Tax=Gracilinema caldarium TaxID=215591 RepID=UPI0003133AB7|nr:MerR family DNA-binding transcriptional regulator [Gracilinema caldarium]